MKPHWTITTIFIYKDYEMGHSITGLMKNYKLSRRRLELYFKLYKMIRKWPRFRKLTLTEAIKALKLPVEKQNELHESLRERK